MPLMLPPSKPAPPLTKVTVPPALLSAAASQPEPLYFNTWPGVGAVVERFTPRKVAAFTKVKLLPSITGRRFAAATCTICPVVTPVSILNVKPPTEPPPSNGDVVCTSVTSPPASVAGAQADPFHANTWPGVGAVVAILLPRIETAFTNVSKDPSTAGMRDDPFNCKI